MKKNNFNVKPVLIIGLGNPDKQYQLTRHNAGFVAVDFLAQNWSLGQFKEQKKFQALTVNGKWQGQKIILAKPQTYMNNSGQAVSALKNFYQLESKKIIIIYDELDLPFGKIRKREKGSSAGHNGIKSIIEKLGSDKFWRIRIGIRNEQVEKMEAADFVLTKFSKEELIILNKKILPAVEQEIDPLLLDQR